MLGACSGQANRPIPVASAADLEATTDLSATGADQPAGEAPAATETATLAGDLASEETAPPADEPTYETAEPADPGAVMGLDRAEIQALLGDPGLIRREAPAEVWQYQSRGCVLDVFLYEAKAHLEVVYLEARNGAALGAATATCLGSVISDRRDLPTS